MRKIDIKYLPVADVVPYDKNPRKNDAAVPYVRASIEHFGFKVPIVVDANNVVVCGHTRLKAAIELGMDEVPCIVADDLTDDEIRAFRVADNKVSEMAEWDIPLLGAELLDIKDLDLDFDMTDFGFIDADFKLEKGIAVDERSRLQDRFLVPPLSILDSRQGYWKARKDAWNESLRSLKGRRPNLLKGNDTNMYGGKLCTTLTSEFDPVLAEIAMRWFNVEGGSVLDPFSGGCVRGIVSARLGHKYIGFDIRQEQVDANYQQAPNCDNVRWVCDDSVNIANHVGDERFDMVFSCPPYFNLEVYSDKPGDLSNMKWEAFVGAYRKIVAAACSVLKDDRFAMFVIGDVRDNKTGEYLDFIGETKRAFADAGLVFVNDIIYVEPVAGSAIRAAGTFNAGRKIVKTHQNVLVFYKGDLKNVKANFPPILEPGDFDAVFEDQEAADGTGGEQ